MAKNRNRLKPINPQQTSRFRIDERINYDEQKPTFSFKHMKYNGGHCVSRCSQQDKAAIVGKLVQLSQYTWKEIISFPREAYGYELIPTGQFTASLPKYVTPDVDKLMVFRYSQAGRLAGSRDRDIFHILLAGDSLYPH